MLYDLKSNKEKEKNHLLDYNEDFLETLTKIDLSHKDNHEIINILKTKIKSENRYSLKCQTNKNLIKAVIDAMGGNIESSVMTVMQCKEIGVPTVIAKCSNEMHFKILTKVGADKVVFPEKDSGIRMAKNLLSSGLVDVIELSNDVSMIEVDIKKEWIGKNLLELDFRKKYSLNVIAIKENEILNINIDPTVALNNNMKSIVVGNKNKIKILN